MSHSRVLPKSHRAAHRRRADRITLPPICDGEAGVECCGEGGAKRPAGALGSRRMPLAQPAAPTSRRSRVGDGAPPPAAESQHHRAAVRRAKGVVTPLMYACQQNRETQVRELLAQKSDCVLLRDRTMKSALHYCVENSNPASAELVLATAPELLDAPDQEGFTPLHLAVIAGNVSLVRFLLHKRADLTAVDNEKHSVVHWATVCGEVEALEALLEAGAAPSSPDIHGGYPIHYAAQMCGANSEMGNDTRVGLKILRTLLGRHVDVNVVDEDGRPPILWAASAGSADAVLSLVNSGAIVEAEDKDGLTALHCAASRGHTECLETLITLCGAEVNLIDANGCTALFYAVTLGHADCTQLLLKFGSDPNMQDRRGRTAAHCGAAKGQLETLKLLSAAGADLWKRNVRGDFPLHDAVQSGRRELVRWLLAQRPEMVTAANSDGRSCLHLAASSNNVEMCRVLLDGQSFVNPVMRNQKGIMMTPLDSALLKENRGCAKYLQLHGGVPASKLTEEAAAMRGPQRVNNDGQENLTPRPDSYAHLGLTPRDALNFDTSGANTPAIQPESLQIPPVDQTTQTPVEMAPDVKKVERGVSARGSSKSHKKTRSRKSPSTARGSASSSDSEDAAEAKSDGRSRHRSTRKHRAKRKGSGKREKTSSKTRDQKESENEHSVHSEDEDTTNTVKTEIEVKAKEKSSSSDNGKKAAELKTEEKAAVVAEAVKEIVAAAEVATKVPLQKSTVDPKTTSSPKKNGNQAKKSSTESENGSQTKKSSVESDNGNGKKPETKARDPSPPKRQKSPPKRDPSPPKEQTTKREASPPKRDASPPKRDVSPPKASKARPKSGKKSDKQTGGGKTMETDTDVPAPQISVENIDQTGTDNKEGQTSAEIAMESNNGNKLNTSSGPMIIIEESASVMEEEEEDAPIQAASTEAAVESTPEVSSTEATKTQDAPSEDPPKEESEVASSTQREKPAPEQVEKITANPDIATTEPKEKPKETKEDKSDSNGSEKVDPENNLKKIPAPSDSTSVEVKADVHKEAQEKDKSLPSSPKKQVEKIDSVPANGIDEKLCAAKMAANGVSYVILDDEKNNSSEAKPKKKKLPLAKKEKSVEKTDSSDKGENNVTNKRASREVKKEETKRSTKDAAKSKSEDRSGFKNRENKTSLRHSKKSVERSPERPGKTRSVSEEEKVSLKSSTQASLEDPNVEESSDASDRSKAADSGVMLAEPSGSDSPKAKVKHARGVMKVIPDNEDKELINGKPSIRVTPTSRDLTKINARNNRAQIEEDEKKARELIKKRHEQSVVSVTQAVQVSTRKYQLERRIFQELLELKKLQIRAGKANESILVKRAVDEYRKAGLIVGLRQYDGPYAFRSFEQYLYDQLQLLQNSSDARIIARLKPTDDVESLTAALKRSIPGVMHHSPAFCTLSTHRCNHATDAYTTIPVPNYVGRLPRTESFLPRIETPLGHIQSGKGGQLIMSPSKTLKFVDPKRPITLELSHGGERQVIALPTERLDRTKRYYVTFTIKPGDGQPAIMPIKEDEKKHKHASSL